MDITFNEKDVRDYFEKLTGKIYKILPVCENSFDTKQAYIQSLIRELVGSLQISNNAFHRTEYMVVINTLLFLSTQDEYKPEVYRPEVFKCIRIVKKIGGLDEF